MLKQRTWNSVQIYVALSRITSLDGLYLIGEYHFSAITADPRATIEYEIMDYAMKSIDTCSTEFPCSLTISKVIKKRATEINADRSLKDCDVLFFT